MRDYHQNFRKNVGSFSTALIIWQLLFFFPAPSDFVAALLPCSQISLISRSSNISWWKWWPKLWGKKKKKNQQINLSQFAWRSKWSVWDRVKKKKRSVRESARERKDVCVCVHARLCVCGVTDGQISRIRPEARNSSRPEGEAVLFIRGWENKPRLQAMFHLLLSLSLSPPATRSEQHVPLHSSTTTVVCNSLNCHYRSPPGVAWTSPF